MTAMAADCALTATLASIFQNGRLSLSWVGSGCSPSHFAAVLRSVTLRNGYKQLNKIYFDHGMLVMLP